MEPKFLNGLILDYSSKVIEYSKKWHEKFIRLDKIGKGLFYLAAFALLSWATIFLIAFFFVDRNANDLDLLGKTGDFFNVATSLFTAFTVCLVAYTIYQQRLEFEQLRTHSKKEAAIDRTIRLIDEWKEIKWDENYLSKEQYRFINRLYFMGNPKFKDYIDLKLINEFLISEGVVIALEVECVGLDGKMRELNKKMKNESYISKEIESQLATKRLHDSIPEYLKGDEDDLEDKDHLNTDDDVRDFVLSSIEDNIISCKDKKDKYENIINFIGSCS